MAIRALRAFVEVVRSGSFTLAADRLAVTQPTVSKLIGRLEEELGYPLFQRIRRQVQLTDSGRVVLGFAETILAAAANIERALDELAGLQAGELSLGIPSLGPRLFVPLIGEFRRRFPNIELKLLEDGSHAVEAALIDGQLELGGLLAPVDGSRFECRMLVDDRLALLAPARSWWARRPEIGLQELAEEPFILFSPAYALNERIAAACRQCGFSPEVAGRSGQIGFILEMVRCRVGVALLPASQLAEMDLLDFSVSALVDPIIPWRVDLAWLRASHLSAAAKAWLRMLDDMAG